MAWGDPSDYWWLRPTPQENALPAMEFGARLRQQAIANSLNQKQLDLETQRQGMQIQEHLSKMEIQNKLMGGTSALAKMMAGVTDLTDPSVPTKIFGVLADNPTVEPIAKQFLDMHEKAVMFKQKQEQLKSLQEQAGYVPPDEETGAPGYFMDAKGGIRFAPQAKPATASPKWIPADQETGMPAHFEDSAGKVHFAPRSMPDGTTFTPQEMTTPGGTRMVQRTPNQWTVVDKPAAAGKLSDVERAKLKDLTTEQNALSKSLTPPTSTESLATDDKDRAARQKQYQQRLADYNAAVAKIDSLNTKKQAIYTASEKRTKSLPLNTELKQAPITKDEYDKLSAGASYVAPDGSTRVKQ